MFVGEGQNPAPAEEQRRLGLNFVLAKGMVMFHCCVMLWVHPPGTEYELNSGSSVACPGVRCCGLGVFMVIKET